MRRRRTLIAICLMALWWPATLCCALEGAGWDVLCSSESCHEGDATEGPDGCNAVEEGRYQGAVSTVKVAPPVLEICVYLICAYAQEVGLESPPAADFTRPCDWIPAWQFERRAAAPAHAPDSSLA
jgi:hypothetical protein